MSTIIHTNHYVHNGGWTEDNLNTYNRIPGNHTIPKRTHHNSIWFTSRDELKLDLIIIIVNLDLALRNQQTNCKTSALATFSSFYCPNPVLQQAFPSNSLNSYNIRGTKATTLTLNGAFGTYNGGSLADPVTFSFAAGIPSSASHTLYRPTIASAGFASYPGGLPT